MNDIRNIPLLLTLMTGVVLVVAIGVAYALDLTKAKEAGPVPSEPVVHEGSGGGYRSVLLTVKDCEFVVITRRIGERFQVLHHPTCANHED